MLPLEIIKFKCSEVVSGAPKIVTNKRLSIKQITNNHSPSVNPETHGKGDLIIHP